MLTTSHSTVTAVVATRAVGHVNEGELAIGVAQNPMREMQWGTIRGGGRCDAIAPRDWKWQQRTARARFALRWVEPVSIWTGSRYVMRFFRLLCIPFQWPAHLRRRPAPTPFEKGWVAFLKATTTAADLRRMERLTRRSEGCRKTSTKTLEGKTAVTSAALKKTPKEARRRPKEARRRPKEARRRPKKPAAVQKNSAAVQKKAAANNPAVAPNPEATGSRAILTGGGRRSQRSLAASERTKARYTQSQDEPMEIEEGQSTQQSEEASQARSITEPERVEVQAWPQTPSSALEFLSLLTPTGHKRPATIDGGPETTPKRRTFDRPSRRRAAVVAPPASANAGTFVHPAGIVGDDAMMSCRPTSTAESRRWWTSLPATGWPSQKTRGSTMTPSTTSFCSRYILLEFGRCNFQIWTYNQAHADQQAALLNPLFWVRRIFAPNYDRAGNIVQPQMTADERANYFATADTQLTLARNTFRRVASQSMSLAIGSWP
ncbi:hypothetical protein L596_030056 [Steinernema carpocapsae]|uniref:Uncharacterized protein n=1 Tax=Steinernema carpocapsae TaxID=34508 RepID=A0A4U5LRM0_STECR|nr:hypothetical protein L596_030056 [Steinernema carpocapsae]